MHPDFRLPTVAKITGRKSTITGMFFAALTPVVVPSDDEVREALRLLGMSEGACCCAYCGDALSEWDHFRPITNKRRPTGYISEIANMVPSCGKCNQSKGNKHWKAWMESDAKRSPKRRGVVDLTERIERLSAFESWRVPVKIDYESILGEDAWAQHLKNLEEVLALLTSAQVHVASFQSKIQFEVNRPARERAERTGAR